MSGLDDGFKRPKEHIPRESLPKPPRQQLMDQLGLQDEDCNSRTSSSESDDEETVPPTYPNVGTPSTPSRPKGSNEVDELKVILRETQRKLFLANSNLTDSSNSKEKKLKIMKSSHTKAMALKEQLIQDLQDIVQEKDDLIAQLQGGSVNPASSQDEGVRRLVEHTSHLHRENITLHARWEEVCEELKAMKVEKVRLEDELIMSKDVPVKIPLSANSQTTKQIKELTQKIKVLELEKGAVQSSTEAERELVIQVAGLQAQLAALQGEHQELREKNKVTTDVLPQLKAENTRLKAEVGTLTSENTRLKAEVGTLTSENTRLKAEVGTLTSENTSLKANERQLQTKMEALDNALKEKSLYATGLTGEKERLLSELSATHSKVVTLEDAHHAIMGVMKEVQTREKAAVEECKGLRAKVTSLQEQLDLDKKSLLSKVDMQNTKSSQLEKAVEESSSRCAVLESQLKESSSQCVLLQSQLKEVEGKMAQAVSTAVEQGKARTACTNERLATARVGLARVHHSAVAAVEVIADVRRLARSSYEAFNKDICLACQKICHRISGISAANRLLVSKYRKEMQLRKRLHNELVDLRGNIRVFCRVRPLISEDGEGTQADVVVHPDRDDDGVVKVLTKGTWKVFDLDKVFGPKSTQIEVFSEVKDLVVSCMDGFNVCIFAYGQTGSGKTFTMEGTEDNPGINQRALLELFHITEERSDDWQYTVVVSVLEIYNEMVRDLLSLQHTEKMEIKQGPEGNYVPGVTQVQVTCLQEVNQVFAVGHDNRATGSTKMNIQSSRSHALLCVTVHGKCKTTGVETFGKLNLIDLAGSERVDKSGSDGIRLQEAKHINKSLSALGDVIHSLKSKSPHIPYRNSKLTYLLQDSLSGDSKTLMVVQVAPVEKNGLETVCSLNFAQRVRAVELGQAVKKVMEGATEKVV